MKQIFYQAKVGANRLQSLVLVSALVLSTVAPLLLTSQANAAPGLLNRKLESTSAVPSSTTQLKWTFDTTADTANARTIELEFCDSPLGSCNTTKTPTIAASPSPATLGGPWTTTSVTSTTRTAGRTGGSNNQVVIVKTTGDDATSKTGLTVTLGASDITNNATANASYYVRVRIFSDNPPTVPNLKWEGVFAQSTSRTLTVNARVQERLDFCVGATAVNDATTSPATDCSAVTGNSVDIGNIDSGSTNVSPVLVANGGSNTNGVAMIRTNAVNGASVAYRSLANTSSGALKVPGATCVASPVSNTLTDQCFNTSSTQGAITAGTELFGMTVAAINPGSTTAYSCTFAAGTCNVARDTAYDGTGANTYVSDADIVAGTTAGGYAWDSDPSHVSTIATSTGSSVKVIDDEALILKFAATASITTPTGAYTTQADFIATTTF